MLPGCNGYASQPSPWCRWRGAISVTCFRKWRENAGASATVFCIRFCTSLPHISWEFQPKVISRRGTRSDEVASRSKSLWLRCSYIATVEPIWNFQIGPIRSIDNGISIYKTYFSEFRFRWPKVGSLFYLSITYKLIRKCSNALYSKSTGEGMLITSTWKRLFSYTGPLSMNHMQFWRNDRSFPSFELIWDQMRF